MGLPWVALVATGVGVTSNRSAPRHLTIVSIASAIGGPRPHIGCGPWPRAEGAYWRECGGDIKIERIDAFGNLIMPDYYSLLVRAVTALDSNAVNTRRVIYGMARDSLVKQGRAMQPPIREADLTKERLKLERAIRKVEAEELEGNASKKALIRLARHIEALLPDLAVR